MDTRTTITESSVVKRADSVTSAEVDGESVLLDLSEGTYYGLNPVGARIWDLIQEPTAIGEVVDEITAEYDVARGQCLDDTIALVAEMSEDDIVVVQDP